MLDILKEKNPDIKLYSVNDSEFKTFGRVVEDLDTAESISAAEKIKNPEAGSAYSPSEASFEKLKIASQIKNEYFGTLPTQIGYCHGHNSFLNAAEWHFSSEINIAVTPLVLILGHVWDIENGKIDSSSFKAFYLPQGTAVEVYSTTLHFCPCEVEKGGFGCVVGLPLDTNTPLDETSESPLLFRKNKWLIAHEENTTLINRGAVSGITGTNFEIKY
ncbi:MAG: DUF4867 family protein [Acutalibacteraceae bacterium]